MSPNALRTLYRLHSHGFTAYLVGGCVRDLLLGRNPKDFDIGTDATPGQIKRLFRNCRLVGRRFRLAHLHFQDEIVEVSTFRRAGDPSDNPEPEDEGGRKRYPRHITNEDGMVLVDNVFGTPEEDALRRDFTINALAYNIADFSVIDFSTGLKDLRDRVIRPIGDPRVRFTEDPVRMIRAVRFAASHDFVVEPAAWECLRELAPTISRASPARLYEEVQKLFLLGSARPALILLWESGLLAALFADLGRWIEGDGRRLQLLEANLECLDKLHRGGTPPSPALFLAALFGPSLEEAALVRHREGIPYHQALEETCALFMKDLSRTVTIPGRAGGRVKAILALQALLHRMPPRRPAGTVGRPEFAEALAYLRLGAQAKQEYQAPLKWWDAFLVDPGSVRISEGPAGKGPRRRRRRRRGTRGGPHQPGEKGV